MRSTTDRFVFVLFVASGFCGLSYQMIWTRIALATFGITTPVLSVVVSAFMAGLAAGSWAGGRLAAATAARVGLRVLQLYALAEVLIGLGGLLVPVFFRAAQELLLGLGETHSLSYALASSGILVVILVPWCICMGATIPLMMATLRLTPSGSVGSFGFLYTANVAGAVLGTLATPFVLIELFGFRATLIATAAINLAVAAATTWLGRSLRGTHGGPAFPGTPDTVQPIKGSHKPQAARPEFDATATLWALFATGFVAMAAEVVWTREFTPVLKTQVYSFASIVLAYLIATSIGAAAYRRHHDRGAALTAVRVLPFLLLTYPIPILVNDSRFVNLSWLYDVDARSAAILLMSILPFSAVLGYLTPNLIDRYSSGDPRLAGRAYAVNALGCILGPLVASYLLLPQMSGRYALIALSVPVWLIFLVKFKRSSGPRHGTIVGAGAVLSICLFWTNDFEALIAEYSDRIEIVRDYAGSVVAAQKGEAKVLLVNGIGMTKLTPITKLMVHLPLAFHHGQPQSALVVCFGMGTTFRSAMSWGIDVTAVELVPSVFDAFDFFHSDAPMYRQNPRGHFVVDDGRRYLMRTPKTFDVIVIDPPPPPEAAGSSLLYSREFMAVAKEHLASDGVIETWFFGQDTRAFEGVLRSVTDTFSTVRLFYSVEGWGVHILASNGSLEGSSGPELVGRLPVSAQRDLTEWTPSMPARDLFALVLKREIPIASVLNPDPRVVVSDDRPLNEYFLLRRLFGH